MLGVVLPPLSVQARTPDSGLDRFGIYLASTIPACGTEGYCRSLATVEINSRPPIRNRTKYVSPPPSDLATRRA